MTRPEKKLYLCLSKKKEEMARQIITPEGFKKPPPPWENLQGLVREGFPVIHRAELKVCPHWHGLCEENINIS
jgi:hypothetical protein